MKSLPFLIGTLALISAVYPGQAQQNSTASAPAGAASAEPRGPIPITFRLQNAGYVTLVIENESGQRVRNLLGEMPFPAGENTVWWDGLDDLGRDVAAAKHAVFHIPGKLVPAGKYGVRGLVRPALQLIYRSSPYTHGKPPWKTADRGSQWLANHTAPGAVLFVPPGVAPTRPGKPGSSGGQILVGSFVSEGGSGLAWLDMEGNKLNGQVWLGGVWTAASHLARDRGPRAVPGVYAYAGAGWTGDKYNGNVAELRLNELVAVPEGKAPKDWRMGNGEDRPVLTPTYKIPAAPRAPDNMNASESGDKNPLSGLAVHNGLLVASLKENGLLVFVDAAAHKTLGTATVAEPGGLAFDRQGRLLVLSGNRLLRFTLGAEVTGLSTPEVLIENGLEQPQQITLDNEDGIYISDWGNSHQVKFFSPQGRLVRTFGKGGKPRLGFYDAAGMHKPNGITLDERGRLWVAETDKIPKRVSVWRPDGSLERAFYGPAAYGGGGWLDTRDKSRFYYSDEGGAMELKLDPETGASVPVNIYYRPELDQLGLRARYTGVGPQTPIHIGERTYLTNAYNSNPTGGAASAQIWQMVQGVASPVAALGRIQDSAGKLLPVFLRPEFQELFKEQNLGRDQALFAWSDRNGNAVMEPQETNFLKADRPTYADVKTVGGVTVQADLSFVVAYVGDKAMRFAPQGFDERGVPLYDAAKGEVLATGVQRQTSSGGGQALHAGDGWTVLTTAPSPYSPLGFAGVRQGKALWSYPSLWPGLHASHHAPKPSEPGQVIGTTRLLGNTVTPRGSEVGELWAINGNKGDIYLFTVDGLFVATLFRDSRDASWDFPQATPGMQVESGSTGEESFWPSLSQTSDGGIYLQANGNVVQVQGLEGIRRMPAQQITVSERQLQEARSYFVKAEAARQAAAKTGPLTMALLEQAPVLDGKLEDWDKAKWVTIDTRFTQVGNWGRRSIKTEAALAISGDRLYAAFRTDDAKQLANSGESLQNLFKTGGGLDLMLRTREDAVSGRGKVAAGDLRLLVTQVKNKTTAMLYRPVVPGTSTDPVQFASPLRTLTMDRVDNISDQVILATGVHRDPQTEISRGLYEFSVPLATLGLAPRPGMQLWGDVGVLRGNGFETLQRIYWHNKATGLVSDLPSEAELLPALWGQVLLK